MTHKESVQYLLSNCAFDSSKSTINKLFSAVGKSGYFRRTLHKDFYWFHKEKFGNFPKLYDKPFDYYEGTNPKKYLIHEMEMLCCEPDEFHKYFRDYLVKLNKFDELKNGNFHIVVWYGWEGDDFTKKSYITNTSIADELDKIYDEFDIPRKKIIFLVSNLIIDESLKKVDNHYEIWGENWMEVDVLERDQPHKRNLSHSFDDHFKELKSNVCFNFLRANRTNNEDRDFLLFDIFRRNIEKNFLLEHRWYKLHSEMTQKSYPADNESVINRIKKGLPYIASSKEVDGVWNDELSNEVIPSDIYVRSGISLISTTFPHRKEMVFFHGSTFEPMMNFHPFLLNANQGFLQRLKESNYTTFDNVFDESYDLISNDLERRITVIDEVEKFCNITADEYFNLIFKCKERILHNRNTLIECNSIKNGHKRLANHLNE